MLVGGVVHDQVGDDPEARAWAASRNVLEVVDRAEVGVDVEEVGDVVAVVAERRGVHRQEPDAVDAEVADVVELLGHPAKVAHAVAVASKKDLTGAS